VLRDGVFSVNKGHSYDPIFGREQLRDGHSFDVKIVDATQKLFKIGVAHNHAENDCIWISAKGAVYQDGDEQEYDFKLNTGDTITVYRSVN
jgi:hypothetical protein